VSVHGCVISHRVDSRSTLKLSSGMTDGLIWTGVPANVRVGLSRDSVVHRPAKSRKMRNGCPALVGDYIPRGRRSDRLALRRTKKGRRCAPRCSGTAAHPWVCLRRYPVAPCTVRVATLLFSLHRLKCHFRRPGREMPDQPQHRLHNKPAQHKEYQRENYQSATYHGETSQNV
jgi:hypothetical protein